MAELTEEQRDRVLPAFLRAYDLCHGAVFEMANLVEPNPDPASDYCFSADGDELKVQWTRADIEEERRTAPQFIGAFQGDLSEMMGQMQLRGYVVEIVYAAVPKRNKKQPRASLLADVLGAQVRNHTATDWVQIGTASREMLAALESLPEIEMVTLYRVPGSDEDPVVLGAGPGDFVPSAVLSAKSSIERKKARLGPSAHDLVLVVHFDMFSHQAREAELMRDHFAGQDFGFREIWAVSEADSGVVRVHRIDAADG